MGRPWFGWGDWRKPEDACLEVRGRLAANDPRFYLFVGHALAAAGQAARAAEALKKALDLVPTDARVAWEVAQALRAASSPEAAGAFMLAGRRFLILRRFDDAASAFRLAGNLFEAHAGLGEALFGSGRWPEAAAELATALGSPDAAPTSERVGEVRALRAVALARAGQMTAAIDEVETAARAAPRSARVQAMRGDVLLAAGRAAPAVDAFVAALAAAPTDEQSLLGLCRARTELDASRPEAARACGEAAEKLPASAEAQRLLGRTLEAAGRTDEAAAAYRAALAVAPRDLEANHLLGNLLGHSGQIDAALERLAAAAEIAPNDVDVLVDRASVLLEAERLDEALATADRAVALDPRSRRARAARGWVLLGQGLWDDAAGAFRPLTTEAPGEAEGWHGLGMAELSAGRFEPAAAALARAAAAAPDDPQVWSDLGVARMNGGSAEGRSRRWRRRRGARDRMWPSGWRRRRRQRAVGRERTSAQRGVRPGACVGGPAGVRGAAAADPGEPAGAGSGAVANG